MTRTILRNCLAIADILNCAHRPVTLNQLAERLEVSPRTVARTVAVMRAELNLPVQVAPRRGHYFAKSVKACQTLPGLLFADALNVC